MASLLIAAGATVFGLLGPRLSILTFFSKIFERRRHLHRPRFTSLQCHSTIYRNLYFTGLFVRIVVNDSQKMLL
jgi:hypothetical protein